MERQVAFDWEGAIQRRRDIILNHLLLTGVIGGGIALVLLFLPQDATLSEHLWKTLPFIAGWLFVLVVWLLRKLSGYYVRAWALLLITYLLGFSLLVDGGLVGSGRIWLVLFPMVAVALLDVWPGGILACVVSILTYIFFAFAVGHGILRHKPDDPTGLGYWITEGGDFLMAVAGLVLGMWGFRQGWLEALRGTGAVNERLEIAMSDLRTLNEQLDARVNERTRQLSERTEELSSALARERSETNKNQAILEGIADGVIVFDRMGKVTTANPAMGTLLGRSTDSILGQTFETLMGQDMSEDDREMITRLLQDGAITWSGFKFKWSEKTFAISIAPMYDNADVVTGMVAVFRDFTREAEIDRMKSLFVSIASHDLRTPLNSILGYTEMLYEGVYGELEKEQQDVVGRVVANTRHMLGLVNNLLDRAQIEAGALRLTVAPFSSSELLADVLKVMDVLARTRGLTLSGQVAEDVPDVLYGDWQRLNQILVNLLSNAIKFTEEGKVQVRMYLSDPEHWAIEVSDTGCGISRQGLADVFDPFRRGGDSAKYGGSGLGLSIVKQLVEMMGGEVTVESEVGRGSVFTVMLPLGCQVR
jgi:PAS domain S-box-containing protein